MELQGRELKINLSGEDVKLLHRELGKLGFGIPDPEVTQSLFGEGTHEAVREFQSKHGLETTSIVDERTAEAINREIDRQQAGRSFLVKGTVRHVDGTPFATGLVRAFDRDLRTEQHLDEAPTDEQGRYEVRYSADQFGRAEKKSADLVVRAYNNADDREPAAESPIFFNAGAEETIDLVVGGEVYRGPSEYEQLVVELTPLLGDLSFADLQEDDEDNVRDKHQDITFLSGETKQDPGRIAFLALAHRLFKETDVPVEVFYGMFRQGLPTQLPALLAQSPDVQRRALVRSAEANIIPSRFGTEADALVDRFKMVIVRQAMKQPPDGGDGTATLNDLLGVTLSDAKLRTDFLSAYVDHTGPVEDFWKGLAERSEFKDRIVEIQLTLQLGALTGNHLPLVRELRKIMLHGEEGASAGTDSRRRWLRNFRNLLRRAQQGTERSLLVSLASRGEEDWLEIITKDGDNGPIGFPPGVPGKDDTEKARNYAKAMAHIVEDAFPTAFIAQRLKTDDLLGDDPLGKDDVLTFFEANPEFDIKTMRIESFVRENRGAPGSLPVDEERRKKLTKNIRAMQRVYKLAPRYAQMSALIKEGVDSAHRISRMGRNVFMRKFGARLGGNAEASAIYYNAREVNDTALSVLMDRGPMIRRVGMHAVPDETVTEVDGVPEWSTLFGSIELCECEHCRSIHGPAAYLVDILKFLEDRESRIVDKSVKDVLFMRRLDLGEIELTCANTGTELPYVDLVNEALENAVAAYPEFKPSTLDPAVEADLNSRTVSQALSNAFRNANPPLPPLSTEAVITVGAKGKPWDVDPGWWTIDEPGFTYTIRKDKQTDALQVVARSLQTKGSEAERAANPQYVNAKAYTKLSRAVYPWSLPFSLWWEEARAYLGHLGVARHRIMEAFRPGDRAAILNDVAVAYEYLGLSHEVDTDHAGNVAHHGTAPIITGVTNSDSDPDAADPGLWNLWGFATRNLSAQDFITDPSDTTRRIASGNWLSVLSGRVDVFLHQSGLKYRELLDLLDTYYVNPVAGNARAIRIRAHGGAPEGTCETDRLRLDGFDQAAAARTVRLVRLWRALGWSMRDLDRAITAFNPAHFDDLTNAGAADNDRFLVQLAHVQRLHATLNVPVLRLLGWWAEIDSGFYIDHRAPGQPRAASLYDQLFRNRAVTNPLDPDFPEVPGDLVKRLFSVGTAFAPELNQNQISAALRQEFQNRQNPLSPVASLTTVTADARWQIIDPETDSVYSIVRDNQSLNINFSRTLSKHGATITAALGISAADFTLLLNDENVIPRIPDPADPTKTIPDDKLTLDHLSRLHRHASLAKALRLPVRDYLVALKLITADPFFIAADPFATTTHTVIFVETVDKVREAGFTVAEVDYLLRHAFTAESAIAPTEEAIATFLNELRAGLQKIAEENIFRADPNDPAGQTTDLNGDLTRQKLALLNWDRDRVEEALATLNGTVVYKEPLNALPANLELPNATGDYSVGLNALPAGFAIPSGLRDIVYHDTRDPANKKLTARRFLGPQERTLLKDAATAAGDAALTNAIDALFQRQDELQGEISYDAQHHVLQFTGPMTNLRRQRLLDVPNDATHKVYRDAVQELYYKPRRFIRRAMRTFAVHPFAEDLAALPAGVKIPAALKRKVYFDATAKRLHCVGVMSEQEREALLGFVFRYPIGITGDLDAGRLPQALRTAFEERELVLSAGAAVIVNTPGSEWQINEGNAAYLIEKQGQELRIYLVPDRNDANNVAYRAAVRALYDKAEAAAETFLTNSDAAALFDAAVAPGDRFLLVLKKLLPHLRRTLSEQLAVQKTAEALQLEARSAEALLRTWLASPADPGRRCLAELLAPAFAESNTNVQPTPATFPAQFKTFLRVHKAALVASHFKLTHRQLGWLFEHGPDAGWLDLNALPTDAQPQPAANTFDGWLRLAELAKLRDGLPQDENALDEILARASAVDAAAPSGDKDAAKQAWFAAVTRWTLWTLADLEALLGAADDHTQTGPLNVTFPGDYLGVRLLVRLHEAFDLLKRLGTSAKQASDLSEGNVTLGKARGVRQAVRAKYDEAQWLNLAKPLHDVLREKKRAALVAYLVAHLRLPFAQLETPHPELVFNANPLVTRPAVRELQQKLNAAGANPPLKVDGTFGQTTRDAVINFQNTHELSANGIANAATWAELDKVRRGLRDANDLFAHFLIDVEMDPCMVTSRIKQALSSVQLFVQRCLMNLEPEVAASAAEDEKWREWRWMKNYRVWEANRKVFLYPENWIEPELRDDKSPFFKELESELLQSDLTLETAEEAFLHYLEKLDQVARLEIVGIYHQVETHNGQPDGNVLVDILHVFARTPATPHVYFYRQRVDSAYWTAWERLDLDIEGDHLIPVVWNRRLMLIWPIFMEKALPLQVAFDGSNLSGTPEMYWEIKLAWSERKQGKWTNKRLSSQPLGPIPLFRPRPGVNNDLSLHDDPSHFFFRTVVDNDNNLHVLVLSAPIVIAVIRDKVRALAFRFEDCHAEPAVIRYVPPNTSTWPDDLQFVPVTDTVFDRMFYREDVDIERMVGEKQLYLPAPTNNTVALAKTPGTFLLLPYADGSSIAEHPFFFQDDKRAFFVIPSDPAPSLRDLAEAEKTGPDIVVDIPDHYWRQVSGVHDLIGPIVNPEDPWISVPSFPVMPEASVRQPGGGVIVPGPVGFSGSSPAGGSIADHATMARAMSEPGSTPVMPTMNRIVPGDGMHMARATTSARIGLHYHRTEKGFLFRTFYHPYVCTFVRELNRNGVDGLLQRPLQLYPHEFAPREPNGQPLPPLDFKAEYNPRPIVVDYPKGDVYPKEDVDFTEDGAYALYNWELFFHAPLLIADRLSKNQRYEDAQKWFHYIFDPTDASSLEVPQRYWRTKPFHETTREGYQRERIHDILDLLAKGAHPLTRGQLSPEKRQELERFKNSVERWRKDPFKPHLIARMRTTAYQKTVVMRYIDNLIAWADQLFRRDTIESNNEATQLYILAAEILGRRPEDVPPRATPRVQTYNSLEPDLDSFSNALVQIEEFISPSSNGSAAVVSGQQQPPTLPLGLYFCVSKNDKLLDKWDTVADRLFKLRHCMNIEGVVRQLPLFEPPIEPGLLVKAAAAGVDLGSVLNDLSAAQPHYRFNVLAQKATELCAELKSLGQSMLSALEKRDAEQLSLLRAQQETALLALVEQVRELQYDEAEQNKIALSRSRDTAVNRFIHYQKLLGVQSPQVPGIGEPIPEASPSQHVAIQEEGAIKMIPFEKEEIEDLEKSDDKQEDAEWTEFAASIAHLIPNFATLPWGVGTTYGGPHVASALSAVANRFRAGATQANYQASKAARFGQYALRAHEWLLQSNLAAREIMQIDQQYLAAELRRQIAEKELSNHKRQLDNAREVEEFLRDKYTNQELYGWMIGQLATVYFQTYQLAYDLAKRAERAFRHELGLQDSNYIQFGYWDSLKKGLLAGERLFHDLKRMEVAYLDQNKREYEITKHVSLAQLDPLALVQLRQTGACLVRLPEALFDVDYPGHYMRRTRSVSVSIPCVTGPYTGVNCTLTLLKSSLRHGNTLLGGKYARQEGDPRFTDSLGAIQSIVTSDGQNDGGLFETNLRDERYLPFEGAGVIGDWQIELPADFRQFDYDTISDVILHVSYTAREGGGLLKQQVTLELQTAINEFIRSEGQQGPAQIFSLRHEFPTEWHRFLNPANAVVNHNTVTLGLTKDRFPFLFQNRRITVGKIEIFIKVKPDSVITHNDTTLKLTFAAGNTAPTPLSLAPWNGLLRTEKTLSQEPGNWTINAWLDDGGGPSRLDPEAIEEFVLLCEYTVE